MERSISRLIFCTFISILFFSQGFAQEPTSQYYLEKITLSSTPIKSCIYKVFKGNKVLEDCRSIGYKLGVEEGSADSLKYVFMHPMSKDELGDILFIWTMFHLESDLLVSTKLRVPKVERLISDGMSTVLEDEARVLESRVKVTDVRLQELNKELSQYLNTSSASEVVKKIYSQYERKRNEELDALLRSGALGKETQGLSQGRDIRGELSEQLRDIMEGRVR